MMLELCFCLIEEVLSFFGVTELSCLQAYFLEQGLIGAYHASRSVLESLIKPIRNYLLRCI